MIKPLYTKVVVKVIDQEESKSPGGIIKPITAKKSYSIAEVVAAGDGAVTQNGQVVPMTVKVGDKVLINPSATLEIVLDGENYLVIDEQAIIGVL